MTKFVSFFFLLALVVSSYAAQGNDAGSSAASKVPLEAQDYCRFLMAKGISDENHYYDEKMRDDAGAACIERSGTPGNYFYEIISGKENVPVTFISATDFQKYCSWKNRHVSLPDITTGVDNFSDNDESQACDHDLKSNIISFSVFNNAPALLGASSQHQKNSCFLENLGIGFILCAAFAGGIYKNYIDVKRESAVSGDDASEQSSVDHDHFQKGQEILIEEETLRASSQLSQEQQSRVSSRLSQLEDVLEMSQSSQDELGGAQVAPSLWGGSYFFVRKQ